MVSTILDVSVFESWARVLELWVFHGGVLRRGCLGVGEGGVYSLGWRRGGRRAEGVHRDQFGKDNLASLGAHAAEPAGVDIGVRAGGLATSGSLSVKWGSGLAGGGACSRVRSGCQEFIPSFLGEIVNSVTVEAGDPVGA